MSHYSYYLPISELLGELFKLFAEVNALDPQWGSEYRTSKKSTENRLS